MKRYILSIVVMLVSLTSMAQEFTTLDWQQLRIDSILPVYTEVVPLESDYRQCDYKVEVEYPEWAPLTEREVAVVSRYSDQIGEDLHVESHVGVMRKVGMLDIAFVPIVRRNDAYYKLLSARITINPQKKPGLRRTPAQAPAQRYASNSVFASGRWYKIGVTEDGIYRLTRSALAKMGFKSPENVHLYGYGGHRLPENWNNPDEMYDDLQEIPLYKLDDNTFLFWGNGLVHWENGTRIRNTYARQGCYFLTEGGPNNLITTVPSQVTSASKMFDTFTDHVLYEPEEFAYFQGGRNLFDAVDYKTSNQHTYILNTPNMHGSPSLTVVFTANNDVSTTVVPSVNGNTLSSFNINKVQEYQYAVSSTKKYDVTSYAVGDDWRVTINSTAGNEAHLDYLAMTYTRRLQPNNGYVAFSQDWDGAAQYNISGTGLQVMQMATPGRQERLLPVADNGQMCSVVVDDASARYVAFNPWHSFPEPQPIGVIANQNLHSLGQVDMVIIIPARGTLYAEAQRLADAHAQHEGLRVAVVRADQIYNEFSSGTPDATAYRRLMKMFYDRAQSDQDAPRYLLLMGDCAWDNRMLCSQWSQKNPDNYLLCFESENSFSDTESYVMEDYFGLLDDGEGASLLNDKTDLGVGRFPVVRVEDAKVMVDKSINHLTNVYAGNWKNVVCVMGDDGDNNEHMDMANRVADHILAVNPEMEVRKLMWDTFNTVNSISGAGYPGVETAIHQQMQQGALVMNYTGHGATYTLSHEFVMQLKDFQEMKGNKLPLWVTAACDIMPFDGLKNNIGETAVLNPNGAAVAFYGTARTVYANSNYQLNDVFMKKLFATDALGVRNRVGDAIRLTKTELITNPSLDYSYKQNKLQYALLGDPALTFGAPLNRVVLDEINGVDVRAEGADIILKAGMHVQLKGHVEDMNQQMLEEFYGTVSARVYDNLETITCKNNEHAKSPFVFTDRTKVLYNGTDSVRNGQFLLEFVVPVDINYSDEGGRVVFYAINNTKTAEANGYNESFKIGGVDDNIGSDPEGPQIYCYLNDESFENGGKVNPTPYFVAQLSDESGISYSGNGLGHDLTLVVDNDPERTYVLNDYYVGEFGNYRQGIVAFSIPELGEGQHQLMFRAWDVLNHTNKTTLDFVVDAKIKPEILNVAVTQSPATTSTSFVINYDLRGSECEFLVEVFDFAGRRMWHHRETGSSETGQYEIPWDLTMDGGGKLTSGIYLYRVAMTSGKSKWVRESQKLIIKNNK